MKTPLKTDYLIVGSGLTGSVIARLLADTGADVLVVDRREHIGGNVYDEVHACGIWMNRYGPHYFRTNSERIWSFVNRFSKFYPYEAIIKTMIDGQCEHWPVNLSYVRRAAGEDWQPGFTGEASNFEEGALSKMPGIVYEKFIKGYTQKQWGKEPRFLSAKLARRIELRESSDPRLMQHKYQGIPENGYTPWVKQMLEGVKLELGCDYLKTKERFIVAKKLIFTGCIDEFFDFKLGKLAYRGQQRTTRYYPDQEHYQSCGQVNYPSLQDGPQIRDIEWKYMMDPARLKGVKGTLVTQEVPFTPGNCDQNEYPMADEENTLLYQKYQALAADMPQLVLCGRLATYQYLDMDQAIAKAMVCANYILNKPMGADVHDLNHQTH